ncbi:MAG: NAD(P)/FAD-dependent oxidoreductase, partial [candidate division Zixibacteria bacterium]|nr:NAD(P)/FAD-dependent oxidoreductase [candidate division Zixibacteria bacterium]
MAKKYDLIVIGTGVAGRTAISKCAAAGWNTAIIDSRPFGGTCALRGCDPKKVLVGAAEIIERSQAMKGKGIDGKSRISWRDLIEFKRSFTRQNSEMIEKGFTENGIDSYHGVAQFTGQNHLKAGYEELEGKHILIAAGSKPRELDMPGEEHITHSDRFLELDTLPGSITFIGGGYISFEFAHIAACAGSEVRILHIDGSPLRHFDPELVKMLVESFRKAGIDIRLNAPVTSIENKGNILITHADDDNRSHFESEMVVHGAGRVPDIDGLNLNKAKVDTDKRGIIINEYLQSTTNPSVYVAGDVNSRGIPLTPVAAKEGEVAARNMLEGNRLKPDYTAIPSVVFAYPPMASVGILETEAKEKGLDYEAEYFDTSTWYTSGRIGLEHSASKTIIDKDSGMVLGAHLLGYNADEVINIFALAIKHKIKAEDLSEMIMTYPTA